MRYNPFSLHDKTIFITGASSGIGRAAAIECSKMGADVIITGRNSERLDETFSNLSGINNQKFISDLTRHEELENLIKLLPELDGVFCNAGIIEKKPVQYITEEKLDSILRINTIVPIMMTRHLVKFRKLKNPSSIVFSSSIAGVYSSSVGNSMYSTSKGALNAYMKNAALDLASKGIRCNSVNPGIVETNLLENTKLTQEQISDLMNHNPLKRLGHPDDVAYAVIYLLSDASRWVTGSSLVIDGGFTLK